MDDARLEALTPGALAGMLAGSPPAPWIALLGVDGSGKSSVLRRLGERQDELPYRRLHVFHRRPRLIHPARGPKGQPISHYGKPNHAAIKSLFKLAALVVDWRLGYRRQIRPLQQAGVLVIADRHSLLDILADPQRYRYGGPAWAVRWALRMAPMPDLILLLDAPPKALLERKQELDLQQMARLRKNYLDLARSRNDCAVIDAAQPLDQVTTQIVLEVMKWRDKAGKSLL